MSDTPEILDRPAPAELPPERMATVRTPLDVPTPASAPVAAGAPAPAGAPAAGTAAPARGPRRAPARLRALDGLRLLAALMVAAYHLGGRNGNISDAWGTSPALQFPQLSQIFAYGCLGVQIFFVISGFVICMSGWGRSPRAFFASRVSRLMPSYWVAVVLVTAVFALPWVAYEAVSPSDALVNMTMMQQPVGADRVLGVCWTLWVELRFYALFALVVVLPGATWRRVVLFCAGWTLATVLTDAADWAPLELIVMPRHAPLFIGGMGLYLIHRFGHHAVAWGIVVVSWLLAQHYAVDGLWRAADAGGFSYRSSAGIIGVVTLGYVLVALIAVGRFQWANWRWLTVAGALTYPFYLVHEHLGWVAVGVLHQRLGLPSWAVLPLAIGGLLVLARLLNALVERPLTPLLRRLLQQPASRPSGPPDDVGSLTHRTKV